MSIILKYRTKPKRVHRGFGGDHSQTFTTTHIPYSYTFVIRSTNQLALYYIKLNTIHPTIVTTLKIRTQLSFTIAQNANSFVC